MADFISTLATSQSLGKSQPANPGPAQDLYLARAQVAVTTALAAADTISFFYLPDGALVEDIELISDQIDSNGAPTLTISLGDTVTPARYLSLSTTVGRTANVRTKSIQTGLGYQYDKANFSNVSKMLIFATVGTAAATKVAGNITCLCYYKLPGKSTS